MLFGHRTYDDVLHHWTTIPQPNPFADVLVNADKYVVSRHTDAQLPYPNSTLLAGDATETVASLKQELDGGITVIGSGELVRTLHAAGVIDEYLLLVYPIVLGSGTRLFGDGDRADLALVESATSTTGVLIARYRVR
jgi:dihydrofolate reductase